MIIKLKHNNPIGPILPERYYYAEPADPQAGVEHIRVYRWEDKSVHLIQMSDVLVLPERLSIIAYVLAWSDIPTGGSGPHILFHTLPDGITILTSYANEVLQRHRETIDQIIHDVHLI